MVLVLLLLQELMSVMISCLCMKLLLMLLQDKVMRVEVVVEVVFRRS